MPTFFVALLPAALRTAELADAQTTEDDQFTVPAGSVFENQGNVTIVVSLDGGRYTVRGGSLVRTFSSVDADNGLRRELSEQPPDIRDVRLRLLLFLALFSDVVGEAHERLARSEPQVHKTEGQPLFPCPPFVNESSVELAPEVGLRRFRVARCSEALG